MGRGVGGDMVAIVGAGAGSGVGAGAGAGLILVTFYQQVFPTATCSFWQLNAQGLLEIQTQVAWGGRTHC